MGRITSQGIQQRGIPPLSHRITTSSESRTSGDTTPIPKSHSMALSDPSPREATDKDYQQLWNDVSESPEGAGAIPALIKILADKEGRDFILELKEAELCMNLSDRVSCDLRLPLVAASYFSSGYRRTQSQARREAGVLRHIEETC